MTRYLDPVIESLPYTYDDFYWMPNCSFGPPKMQKYCPQNLTHLGYVKLNGFHDNL